MTTLFMTRLVIETQTPMAINSGSREVGFDTQIARDANGLPYIPGTSLAGVWKRLAASVFDHSDVDAWFGTSEKRSVLGISHGVLLNSKQVAQKGLLTSCEIQQDSVLSQLVLERPHHKERVAINDRGVAEDKHKFDQVLLPKGVRFCIDVRWESSDHASLQLDLIKAQWQRLLSLWQSRLFALGSDTRNGLGHVKLVGGSHKHVLLNDLSASCHPAQQITDFMQAPAPTQVDLPCDTKIGIDHDKERWQLAEPLCELAVQADSYWRFGQGFRSLSQDGAEAKHMIYTEPSFVWKEGNAVWCKPQPILCGSTIKGILAHRVAFHFNKLTKRFAEDLADAPHDVWQARPSELSALFGEEETRDEQTNAILTEGVAGQLLIEDSAVLFDPKEVIVRQHTRIDRFTGGVRRGALFSEELLYQPKMTIKIWLLPSAAPLPVKVLQALEKALDDIAYGFVPLGAGGGRGVSLLKPDPIRYQKHHLVRLVKE